ncbi:MAG: hypothetical protein OXC27_22060 [Caldilineaceae bacterium]|nr:hypothetical protein [Caldilineaceae bacterium]
MSANTPEWAVQIQQNIHQLETKLDQLLHHMQKLTAASTHPQPAPITHPTFCGYPCSWEIDDAGWPPYIYLEDGARASHREKQGHHWYSASLGDGQYGEHYLKFRRATPPEGLLIMPPPTPSNPDPDPDKEPSLHDLHTIGRAVHGHDWHKIGPQLVHTHTNGRTDKSTDMQPAELTALIHALQQET